MIGLVDSYSTIESGLPNYICVALAMLKAGQNPVGLRLDSGDLVDLSSQARAILKKVQQKTGLPVSDTSIIFASDGINEEKILNFPKDVIFYDYIF